MPAAAGDDRAIHPVGPRAQRPAQARGAECERAAEPVDQLGIGGGVGGIRLGRVEKYAQLGNRRWIDVVAIHALTVALRSAHDAHSQTLDQLREQDPHPGSRSPSCFEYFQGSSFSPTGLPRGW